AGLEVFLLPWRHVVPLRNYLQPYLFIAIKSSIFWSNNRKINTLVITFFKGLPGAREAGNNTPSLPPAGKAAPFQPFPCLPLNPFLNFMDNNEGTENPPFGGGCEQAMQAGLAGRPEPGRAG